MWKSRSISVSILYRKSVGKPISDVDQQKFDAWYNESEKHRLYYKRFCVQQEKIMARDCCGCRASIDGDKIQKTCKISF